MFCRSLSFCAFSLGHCVICSCVVCSCVVCSCVVCSCVVCSLIYGFWLSLWYIQTLLEDKSRSVSWLNTKMQNKCSKQLLGMHATIFYRGKIKKFIIAGVDTTFLLHPPSHIIKLFICWKTLHLVDQWKAMMLSMDPICGPIEIIFSPFFFVLDFCLFLDVKDAVTIDSSAGHISWACFITLFHSKFIKECKSTLFDVDLGYSFASERTISCIMCTAADLALLLQWSNYLNPDKYLPFAICCTAFPNFVLFTVTTI